MFSTICKSVVAAGALSLSVADNSVIGYGYDLTQADLWTLKGLVGKPIFSNFSQDVVELLDCPHVAETINVNNTETNSWYQYFSKSIGIDREVSWHGLDYSVGKSLGQSDGYMWWDEKMTTYVATYNVQQCQKLSDSWSVYKNLSDDFVETLLSLPLSPDDAHTLDLWNSAFITKFGSHFASQTSHGAQIKVLSSIEASCSASMDCLMKETCHTVAFVDIYGSNFCKDQNQCEFSDGCESTEYIECTINGGDTSASASVLCAADTPQEDLDSFLSSGDLTSSSSIIDINFVSMADLVAGAGYYDQFYQLSQAIAYAGCESPWAWKADNLLKSSHSCQCDLTCANNGTLNKDTCTCQCLGDEAHGWKGTDCTETYGKCQCAPGSQSNGADQCCVDGNICGSAHESPECSDTEVCCNKDQYATCCPFGYSCDPQSTSVVCVPNDPAVLLGNLLI